MSKSSYIPKRSPDEKFRTLIVLLDGTGDSVDNDVTNIVRLRDMLCDEWNENQKVLYVQGIGSKMDDSWQSWTHRMIDQAIAGSFHKFVISIAYEWLAQNYNDGDKICIFGFSRGAYTARVLAGMINGLGLLPKEKSDQGEKVYDQYDDYAQLRDKARGDPGKLARLFNVVYPLLGKAKIEPERNPEKKEQELLASLKEQWDEFKVKNECQEVFIDFLGCWDSVNSVGYGSSIKLPLTRTNDMVRTFRHAIALDEHRVKFKQTNWKGPRKEGSDSADKPNSKKPRCETNVEEVWFAGCHCDVGGGSVPNGTRPNLAHISLRWMVRECFRMNSSILFKEQRIKAIGIDPSSIYPIVKPRPEISSFSSSSSDIAVADPQTWGEYFYSWIPSTSKLPETLPIPTQSEEELDAIDALAPAYDQLTLHLENGG
ncbi:hypothetical protein BT96DRAFT_443601 [Gymnopus androsaceus JB14]|uniref:T6SS Phospholipase effector Tle1-like catalytic domain-containing protein n=1 Tax=Gymnopus androsaceus JB14 TaxID=1447944 RepID=A0A6A4GQT6_9AGAR|nr:hypothetical protein BT96DRAFT_443601 [Gymnopus androsaceus JB14]